MFLPAEAGTACQSPLLRTAQRIAMEAEDIIAEQEIIVLAD